MQALARDAEVIEENYRPWPRALDAVGQLMNALTDLGTRVQVWRPYDRVPEDRRFWCHGHATLSYHLFGYSIFGGADMAAVLRDEWTHVDKKPIAGDIIVFRGNDGTIRHTARIERAVHSWGSSTAKELSSKNGGNPLRTGQSVEQVLEVYDTTRWRMPDPGSCCGLGTIKQYYRRNDRRIDIHHHFP